MSKREQFNQSSPANSRDDFSRRQKTTAIIFVVFALGVVVIGVIQIVSQIRAPFKIADRSQQQLEAELDLALLDSDGDGISDYDELYVYKTSPYLEDSDSDGLTDLEEINQGSDPNCPVGENCLESELIIQGDSGLEGLEYLIEDNSISEKETEIDLNAVTPDTLREILLDSGYEADVLEQISDEELLTSFREAWRLQQEEEALSNSTAGIQE